MSIALTINEKVIEAEPGATVLDVAHAHGIVIPTLCHHPALPPAGSCRLCVVEVEGSAVPMTACTLKAAPGMVIRTETPALAELRRTTLEMLLSGYDDGAAGDGPQAETEFMHWVSQYGVRMIGQDTGRRRATPWDQTQTRSFPLTSTNASCAPAACGPAPTCRAAAFGV